MAGKHQGQVPEKERENGISSEDKNGVVPSRFEKAFSYIIEENEVKYHTLPSKKITMSPAKTAVAFLALTRHEPLVPSEKTGQLASEDETVLCRKGKLNLIGSVSI